MRIEPHVMITETFHSFHLNDEFTASILADIAINSQLEITPKEMIKKAHGFIQAKKKSGLIELVEGEKWSILFNNRTLKSQVYKKIGELSEWKTASLPPIPKEYYDFAYLWNDQQVGASFTAKDFHQKINEALIEVTNEGQVGKFLWIIADRNLCDCILSKDPKRNIYIRIDAIPDWILEQTTTKFLNKRVGPYISILDNLDL